MTLGRNVFLGIALACATVGLVWIIAHVFIPFIGWSITLNSRIKALEDRPVCAKYTTLTVKNGILTPVSGELRCY